MNTPEDILKTLSEAMSKAKSDAASAGLKAIETRLTAISSALGDVVTALEKEEPDESGKFDGVIDAIRSLKLDVPVTFSPTIQPADVTVQAAQPVNNITVQPSDVREIVVPAPNVSFIEREEAKTVRVEFEYTGDRVLAATITRG